MIFDPTWEIWLILFLQDTGEWLKPLMEFFTWAGYPQAYMLIIAIVYWAFDRKLGMRMAIFLPLTASVNSILKQAIHAPRPYWVDTSIKAIHTGGEFGMPSGHAQAATVWLLLAAYLKKTWFWIIAILFTLMVGLSRVYLGVHFPSQVMVGWLTGIVILICFIRCEYIVMSWFQKMRLANQLLFVAGISLFILFIGWIIVHSLRNWELPMEWIRNVSLYTGGKAEAFASPVGMSSIAGNAGGFLGVTTGAILMVRKGGFKARGAWWKRLLRCVLGLVCMALLFAGMQVMSPGEGNHHLYTVWRFLGFYILSFSALYPLPLLYMRLNLLDPD